MQLTVLKWIGQSLLSIVGKTIEVLFRTILFLLPLGVYLFIIQFRSKASKVSNISVYTTDDSIWQHIFPGFILISIDPKSFKKSYNSIKNKFQQWVDSNKYELVAIFMTVIVVLLVWIGK